MRARLSVSPSASLQKKGAEYGEPGEVIFAPIDEQLFNSTIRDPSAVVPNKAP
ncbi:MAG: hypothetical protein WCI66_09160 [Gammaproteobacteria bacterium]